MGSALHRLEVLLVGVMLLLSGGVVTALLLVRPITSPQREVTTAPIALAPSTPPHPLRPSVLPPRPIPTHVGSVAVAPTEGQTIRTEPSIVASPWTTLPVAWMPSMRRLTVIPTATVALGLSVGCILVLMVVYRRRKRTMPYLNQTIGHLLRFSDASTRAANQRILHDLAAQGLLPDGLALAVHPTGRVRSRLAYLRQWLPALPFPQRILPIRSMPRLTMPHLTMPMLRVPLPSLSRWSLPTLKGWRIQRQQTARRAATIATAEAALPLPVALQERHMAASTQPALTEHGIGERDGHVLWGTAPTQENMAHLLAEEEAAALEDGVTLPAADDHGASGWTPEDRVVAVAAALAEQWIAHRLSSPLLWLDTTRTLGAATVAVCVDLVPNEEERLLSFVPDALEASHAGWRVRWRAGRLLLALPATTASPPRGGPLLVPMLDHGRKGQFTRFVPLQSWRHIGLYGSTALGTLHAMLGSLLYSHPPTALALSIVDHGVIRPLYRTVPHLVTLLHADEQHLTVDLITRALRRGALRSDVRPLLVVVVEPDAALLQAVEQLLARLRQQPTAPVHLVVVQERLQPAGREVYAMLPALLTGGGVGDASRLPGQSAWPKEGRARLVGRGERVEGQVRSLDEGEIARLMTALPPWPAGLPPVVADAPPPLLPSLAPVVAPSSAEPPIDHTAPSPSPGT